jgi:hypothetical protein
MLAVSRKEPIYPKIAGLFARDLALAIGWET